MTTDPSVFMDPGSPLTAFAWPGRRT